jgi:hypothetical protein
VAGPSGKGARPEAARPSAADGGRHCPSAQPRWRTIRVITTTRRLGEALRSLGDLVAVTDAARRGLKSSSCIVMAGSVFADSRDGARGFEIVRVSGESASRSDWLNVLKLQSNQPHAPCRRRRFYLAFPGWGPGGQPRSIPNLRYALRACDGVWGPSSRTRLARQADE